MTWCQAGTWLRFSRGGSFFFRKENFFPNWGLFFRKENFEDFFLEKKIFFRTEDVFFLVLLQRGVCLPQRGEFIRFKGGSFTTIEFQRGFNQTPRTPLLRACQAQQGQDGALNQAHEDGSCLMYLFEGLCPVINPSFVIGWHVQLWL